VLATWLSTNSLWAQKEFSVPLDQLRAWSDTLIVSMNVDWNFAVCGPDESTVLMVSVLDYVVLGDAT